jgi:hypothetical protein
MVVVVDGVYVFFWGGGEGREVIARTHACISLHTQRPYAHMHGFCVGPRFDCMCRPYLLSDT